MNTVSNLENFFARQIFRNLFFLNVHAGPTTQWVLGWQQHPIFSLDNSENYAFIGIKWSFFDVLPTDIES